MIQWCVLASLLPGCSGGGSAAAFGLGPPLGPPEFAQAWQAQFINHAEALPGLTLNGTCYYDRSGGRGRHRYVGMRGFPPLVAAHIRLREDVLAVSSGGFNYNFTLGSGSNAVCRPGRQLYVDPFDGIEAARWLGRDVVAGEPCDVWNFTSTDGSQRATVCLAADGVPRQFNTSLDPLFGPNKAWLLTYVFTFWDAKPGHPEDRVFAPSSTCLTRYPTPLCSGGAVEHLDLYRMHSPKEPLEAANRNMFDALGSAAVLCQGSPAPGKVITRWALEANSSYDQYAFCLYKNGSNGCINSPRGTRGHVGRESALNLGSGPFLGQCSPNADAGSWFSLPASGECKAGEAIRPGGCTWGAVSGRTVSAQCVVDRGFLAACATDEGELPHVRSAQILEAALASNDPSRGGCPDAGTGPELVV